MLRRLDLRSRLSGAPLDPVARSRAARALLPRPAFETAAPVEAVREILAAVRTGGDQALRELTARFDGVERASARVDPAEVRDAPAQLPAPLRAALEEAHASIRSFHEGQRRAPHRHERNGVVVESRTVPVDRAGCYVPGGLAPLASTVLMTAVPAKVAGVPEVVVCCPPARDTGTVPLPVLAAAAIAGVDEVLAVGGAHAIAALAYGTETITPVDVIVGPGNVYVSVAKREVAGEGRVGVPSSFAGPSEVVVVADATTPVRAAAIDIVVQAEHGPNGLAWLITWDDGIADAVTAEVARLVAESPRRSEIEATLGASGYAVVVDGSADALAVANAIGPEHLELMCANAEELAREVRHAGAVFCGADAPASVGDYLAGPSHVLPTAGSARFAGALTVDDFTKQLHVITLAPGALERVAPHVEALATAEGLDAHARSVRDRGSR